MGIDGIGGKPPIGPSAGQPAPAISGGDGFFHRTRSQWHASSGRRVRHGRARTFARGRNVARRVHGYARGESRSACAKLLTPEQLEQLKAQLKEQLENDPTAGLLLQRATGVASAALEDPASENSG